jgi:hypothetical protein
MSRRKYKTSEKTHQRREAARQEVLALARAGGLQSGYRIRRIARLREEEEESDEETPTDE